MLTNLEGKMLQFEYGLSPPTQGLIPQCSSVMRWEYLGPGDKDLMSRLMPFHKSE